MQVRETIGDLMPGWCEMAREGDAALRFEPPEVCRGLMGCDKGRGGGGQGGTEVGATRRGWVGGCAVCAGWAGNRMGWSGLCVCRVCWTLPLSMPLLCCCPMGERTKS